MRIKISGTGISPDSLQKRCVDISKWYETVMSDDISHLGGEHKGWVKPSSNIDEALIDDIIITAKEICDKCTLFIVVGIGGSFLGAQAVIEALNGSRDESPEVVFAGFNMNGAYINKLKRRIANESVCICVISKSGRTVEPRLSYSVLKDLMFAKYGYQEARKRIYAITDEKKET